METAFRSQLLKAPLAYADNELAPTTMGSRCARSDGDDMTVTLAPALPGCAKTTTARETLPDAILADHAFLLSALLDQVHAAVYFKDLQSRFVLINRSQAEAMKIGSPAEAVGKSDFDFFTGEHADQAFADEQEIIRTGCPFLDKEEKETWPDGRITWVSTSKMPLISKDGRIIGTFGISRDVTESRRMREALIDSEKRLVSSSAELATVSDLMVASAGETAKLADALQGANQEISRTISSVADAASLVQASIREISRKSNDSASVAKNAVAVADSAKKSMKSLETSSCEIHNVIKVINSIAQQTNLLALNATIEAARAGEAGKGFAVVAHEVKELARQTARATEQISHAIGAIQSGATEAISAFGQIEKIIDSINDISNGIVSAVDVQTISTNEIGRNMREAALRIDEITTNIDGVVASAKHTTHGAEDTREASRELSNLASRLHGSQSSGLNGSWKK